MKSNEVTAILHEDIVINGKPIQESEMFKTLADMNVSEQYISDYSNGLHNLLRIKGKKEAERKIIVIFRINPLVAVKIIESCQLVDEIDELGYAIKPLFSVLRKDGYFCPPEESGKIILNNNRIPYITLLIEAVFQKSIGASTYWKPDRFLEYAQSEDLKLHKKGVRVKHFNAYNTCHILSHIPENRQIELINWFWDKHCYVARTYGKVESFASVRVRIIMEEIKEGSIWQHLENEEKQELSESEQESLEKEKAGIRSFIEAVISEGRHLQYIKKILGERDFYEKLTALMGNDIRAIYDEAVVTQKSMDLKEKLDRERVEYETE